MTEMTRDIGLDSAQSEPRGMLSIRTLAMPADTNQYGDIFGGWLLGQMDIAGGIVAANIAKSRTARVAVDAITSRKPVYVGDVMCIYTDLIRVGRRIGRGARGFRTRRTHVRRAGSTTRSSA